MTAPLLDPQYLIDTLGPEAAYSFVRSLSPKPYVLPDGYAQAEKAAVKKLQAVYESYRAVDTAEYVKYRTRSVTRDWHAALEGLGAWDAHEDVEKRRDAFEAARDYGTAAERTDTELALDKSRKTKRSCEEEEELIREELRRLVTELDNARNEHGSGRHWGSSGRKREITGWCLPQKAPCHVTWTPQGFPLMIIRSRSSRRQMSTSMCFPRRSRGWRYGDLRMRSS